MVYAFASASNRIDLRDSVGWTDSVLLPEFWGLERADGLLSDTELTPWVARVEATSWGFAVTLDIDMVPGVEYELSCPDLSDTTPVPGVSIFGPPRTQLATVDPADKPLIDWGMSSEGMPFGGDVEARDADLAAVAESDAIAIAVWATLLTPEGRISWDPTFGTNLRQKRVRSVDLAAEQRRLGEALTTVTGVSSAKVQIVFGDDFADISILVSTAAGEIPLERRVADGLQ
jgi:hypothetical protein